MRFSFIVSAYNIESYIEECLLSILSQKGDYEVIVIDDCSTDRTPEIIRSFEPHITGIYLDKNIGLSKVRNLGISMAKGEYLCIVDGDDFLLRNYVSYLEEDLSFHPGLDIILMNFLMLRDRLPLKEGFYKKSFFTENPIDLLSVSVSLSQLFVVRKELYKDIYFPSLLFEDIITIPKLILKSKKGLYDSRLMYGYRKYRPGSLTSNMTSEKYESALKALNSAKDTLGERAPYHIKHEYEKIINGIRKNYFTK